MNPESVGFQALVWVGTWNEEDARGTLTGTRACGYDRIEIPLRTARQAVATQLHAVDPITAAKQ
jgi:hypothetical protein